MVYPDSYIGKTENCTIPILRYVQDKDPVVIFPALGKNPCFSFLATDLGNSTSSGLEATFG